MKEKIESLIRSGKSTNEIQKIISDFPIIITTEYFQKLGFDEIESIKLKWTLKKNNKKVKSEMRAAEIRREMLKDDSYNFSANANPNYLLLDTSTLQTEKGIDLLEKSEKVVVIESTLQEIEKVLKKKKEKREKNPNDIFLIKSLTGYRNKIFKETKYKKVCDESEKYEYVDDKILYFLNNLLEQDRPTLITADVNLANRADSYGFEYILIFNTQNKQEKEKRKRVEPKSKIDKTKTNLFGVSFKVEEDKILIRKYNPNPIIYFVKDEKIQLMEQRIEIEISKFDYIVLLLKSKRNRVINVVRLVVVNKEINVEEEKITFLNEIYQMKMPEEIQEMARCLLIC